VCGNRRRGLAGAAALLGFVCIGAMAASPDYVWHLPRGFPVPYVPTDNPMSPARIALGRRLFFETRLSVTGRLSCASCHDPRHAYSDTRRVALGATGDSLPHNAMALVNVAYNLSYGWTDGSSRSLETQMLEPMLNEHPIELGLKGREDALLAELSADPCYHRAFDDAFRDEHPTITLQNMIKAIATFERTLISGDSPFDRYVFGDDRGALSDEAKQGMELFYSQRIGCGGCHSGFNFSGNWKDAQGATGTPSFANNGASATPIRVPTLRNIALTGPYMHDGRYATLSEVVDHYSRVGNESDSPDVGKRDPRLRPFTLTAQERGQLLAFLESLTDPNFQMPRVVEATPCATENDGR
jgi:cytochrome c peroxidase